MPRRSQARASILLPATTESPAPSAHDTSSDHLALLRRQWRWAAFSQFFFTFAPLFAMNNVTIADIERDLAYQTHHVLPRIMQRLLYTLSYDRKVSLDNWQTALRKQYNKRDPQANPIGPEPNSPRESSDLKEEEEEQETLELNDVSSQIHDGISTSERDVSAPRAASASGEPVHSESASQRDTSPKSQQSVPGDRRGLLAGANVNHDAEQGPSIDWLELPMLSKLESMHTLTEWQFQNPTRLRTLMKNDDELASWRIEPIGYDSKRNAFWFIGGDRLWIQRAPPKAPRSKPLKRKRAPTKAQSKLDLDSKAPSSAKRPRLGVHESQSASQGVSLSMNSPASGRHSRAAKDQAKIKLDAQAKELAELNRQAAARDQKSRSTRQTVSRSQSSRTSSRTFGTRVSARLRGAEDEDWQPIPDEWLNEGKAVKEESSQQAALKTGLESDDETISDLTELSEDGADSSEAGSQPAKVGVNGGKDGNGGKDVASTAQTVDAIEYEKPSQGLPENFVEWETICATLQEWEHIAERFEKATHYSEKALYKVLVNNIVPVVTEELREIEHKRQLEEALVHRKRSSRIAFKESEKEEARLAAKRKQEEGEKMSRARRMEARQQKEEAERIKREHGREQRRKEREAREESRKSHVSAESRSNSKDLSKSQKSPSPKAETRKAKTSGRNGTNSGSRTPAGEDWELFCEICHRQGINLDDGIPMMSCGRCSKWQHIPCHDRADQAAGRPRRDWDSVEFICQRCRAPPPPRYKPYPAPPVKQHPPMNTPQVQAYGSYQPVPPMNGFSMEQRSAGQYPSGYQAPTQQSYYVRPTNGHGQHSSAYGQYATGSSSHPSAPRPTISFSHYQPAEHGFSSSTQRAYSDQRSYPDQRAYPDSNYSYNTPTNPAQPYRPNSSAPYSVPYKPEPAAPAWNITTPAQTPGYNSAAAMPSSSSYRLPPSENHDNRPIHNYPIHDSSQPSFPRYSPEQRYPSTQFKHHPASYQPPLGR